MVEIASPNQTSLTSPASPLPGARAALVLLLCINLFNYIDRQVLAAVVPKIKQAFYLDPTVPPLLANTAASLAGQPSAIGLLSGQAAWIVGTVSAEKAAEAELGWLQTAFMFSYMLL